MRFLLHGQINPALASTLERHEHHLQLPEEILPEEGVDLGCVEGLCQTLQKRQWFLITTDGDFVRALYEQKFAYPGIIVLLLNYDSLEVQSDGIDRLFERYPRLSTKRLYTVTGSRVKIRQLPG